MTLNFQIEQEYGLCVIAASLVAFECLIMGFVFPGNLRGKIFTEEFMKNNFEEEHKTYFSTEPQKFGYPDMGNGRYAQKLSYPDWLKFNKAQRIHYNMLEQLTPMLGFILLGGLYYPVPSAIIGLAFFLARIAFCWYMTDQGAAHPLRIFGAVLGDLCMLGGFIISIMSGVEFYQST